MKKFLLFLLPIMCLCSTIRAQEGEVVLTNPNGKVIDTAINTTAEGPYLKVPAGVKSVGFIMKLITNTGTVAGKVYLQAGRALTSSTYDWAYPYLDSLTLAAGTNNWQMSLDNVKPGYIRMLIVPTGTQNTTYSAYGYLRKLPK